MLSSAASEEALTPAAIQATDRASNKWPTKSSVPMHGSQQSQLLRMQLPARMRYPKSRQNWSESQAQAPPVATSAAGRSCT
jgi:hypothetical protein